MTHSLYYKFVLGYLLFGFLGFATIATFSSEITDQYLLGRRSEALYDEANQIASSYSGMYQGKDMKLTSSYPELVKEGNYLHAQIWIVDRQGKVVSDSAQSDKQGQVIENFDPTSMGNKSYTIGDYYHQFSYDVLSVHAPITGNYNTYGYVVIHLPLSYLKLERDGILNIVYVTSAVVFGLSLIILLVFTKNVYFPLKKITAGANEYAQGNLAHHIEVNTRDEMGYLAATLNYMSTELGQMEEYQKTFIANVSHDFRSPLTSIKGYLEAILDGTIPPEMHEKYLTRVISETDRLNKLTQGLLTLNSLDCKGYLNRTSFDINRVIKDTAASFEGTCSDKNITFDLTFSESIQMVYADLGKIQQVLYNLIDNAIKFSHADSTILIQASVKYEKIFVSIKDTGIGIPKESLKKIWDRFYKSDLSRGKDKKGTGLGLAIVREIIQSHGENIDVVSTEGVGSEFIFSLPKAGAP
jgi:signal transduction histidine kinase